MAKSLLRETTILIVQYIFICTVLGASALAQADQQTVDSFYPSRLAYSPYSLRTGGSKKYSCFVNYDPQTIIAAYSDSFIGDILVLHAGEDTQYHQIYEAPATLGLVGSQCVVEIVEVGGNVGNAVFISYEAANGNDMNWIFSWDGTQLTSMIPTTTNNISYPTNALMSAGFADFYHDGSMQMISVGAYPPPIDGTPARVADSIYRLQNGTFQRMANPSLDTETIMQTSDVFQQHNGNFQKPRTVPGPYVASVTNGNLGGSGRVNSGTITINGTFIGSFTSGDEFRNFNIGGLQDDNTISIITSGPQGSSAVVNIQGQPSGDVNVDGIVDCSDIVLVKAAFGKKTGQAGFDPRADVNADGVVDVRDLAIVSKQIAAGKTCQ